MRHVDEIGRGHFPEAPLIGDHKHPSRFGQGHKVTGLSDLLHVPPGHWCWDGDMGHTLFDIGSDDSPMKMTR